MILILGAGLLGRFTYSMLAGNERNVIGYPYHGTPNPLYIGQTDLTDELIKGCELIRPKPVTFTLWPDATFRNGGKPHYKRPKHFKRGLNAEYAYQMTASKMPFIDDADLIKGKIIYLSLSFPDNKDIEISYTTIDDSSGLISYNRYTTEFDKFACVITIPVESINIKGNSAVLTFETNAFNKDSKDFYHMYAVRVRTEKMNYFFPPHGASYMYVEDHYFKKPYLKRMLPIEPGLIEFQFLAQRRMNAPDIMKLIPKMKNLFSSSDYEIVSIKRCAIEMRRQNKKLISKAEALEKGFHSILCGRFAKQDHSRIHDNLETINKFFNRNLLFE